jgi:hypothetical protein
MVMATSRIDAWSRYILRGDDIKKRDGWVSTCSGFDCGNGVIATLKAGHEDGEPDAWWEVTVSDGWGSVGLCLVLGGPAHNLLSAQTAAEDVAFRFGARALRLERQRINNEMVRSAHTS